MPDYSHEEKRLYARRNMSADDNLLWLKAKGEREEKERKESPQSRVPAFEPKSFTQEQHDARVARAFQPWRPNGLRWAPHKRTMIPEDEWNEDEYQDWKARHYLECFEKVQKLKESVERREVAKLVLR